MRAQVAQITHAVSGRPIGNGKITAAAAVLLIVKCLAALDLDGSQTPLSHRNRMAAIRFNPSNSIADGYPLHPTLFSIAI